MKLLVHLLRYSPRVVRISLARKWLMYFADEALPSWVEDALAEDEFLRQEYENDRSVEEELRASAEPWVAEVGYTQSDSSSPTLEQNGETPVSRSVRFSPYSWGLVASMLVCCGLAYGIWQASQVESQIPSKRPTAERDRSTVHDLRPLLATAQASKLVFDRISTATQQLAARRIPELSAKVGVQAEGLESTLDRASSVGARVTQSFSKMLALLDVEEPLEGEQAREP